MESCLRLPYDRLQMLVSGARPRLMGPIHDHTSIVLDVKIHEGEYNLPLG